MMNLNSESSSRPTKIMGIEEATGSLVTLTLGWPDAEREEMITGDIGTMSAGSLTRLVLDSKKYGISALKIGGLGNQSDILLTDNKKCTVFSGDRIRTASCLLTPKVLCFDGRLVWCMGRSRRIWIYNYKQQKFLTMLRLDMIIGENAELVEDPYEHLVKMQRMQSRKDVIISLWRLPNMTSSKLVFSRYRKKKEIKTFDLNKILNKKNGKATLYDMMLIHKEKTVIMAGTSIMFPANQAAVLLTCTIDGQCKLLDYKEFYFSNNARKRVFEHLKQIGTSQDAFLALNSFNGSLFKVDSEGRMNHLGELNFTKEEHLASQYTEVLHTGPSSADLLRSSKSGVVYLVRIKVD